MKSFAKKCSLGFTLIELMVAVAVAAILLTLGVPSFVRLITDNRLTAQANDIVHNLHYARSEAVKRGETVRLAAVDNSDWGQGWSVVIDVDKDGNYTDVLLSGEAISTQMSLVVTDNPSYIEYSSKGSLTPLGSSFTFTLTPNDCTNLQARSIQIEPAGSGLASRQNCAI